MLSSLIRETGPLAADLDLPKSDNVFHLDLGCRRSPPFAGKGLANGVLYGIFLLKLRTVSQSTIM